MKNWRKVGLIALLERSAEVLEAEAGIILICNTVNGRWPKKLNSADKSAKSDYDEWMALAKQLRAAAKYHKPNPLGGPARIFDCIADRIRAGEPIKDAMDDYGVRYKRRAAEGQK